MLLKIFVLGINVGSLALIHILSFSLDGGGHIIATYRTLKSKQYSEHPQPLFYGPDVRLHLPEIGGISGLNILSNAPHLL